MSKKRNMKKFKLFEHTLLKDVGIIYDFKTCILTINKKQFCIKYKSVESIKDFILLQTDNNYLREKKLNRINYGDK